MRGLPTGWAAQIPHSWVWLDGNAEKEIEVIVWPTGDVNAYKFGQNKEGKYPGTAPFRLAGFIERSYSEDVENPNMTPGSRFYPIGGVFYQVDVRKKATIHIDEQKGQNKGKVCNVNGIVSPKRAGQQILVDVLLPDGKTRTKESKTDSNGEFGSVVSLLDDNGKILQGIYKIQAFIFKASELRDAKSNTVYFTR